MQSTERKALMESNISKKIAKLFALSEGNSNINEAESALKKAEALLVEHNLSMSDIRTEDVKFESVDIDPGKMNIETTCIINILKKHFFVEVLIINDYKESSLRFFGEVENMQSAVYVCNFLGGIFESLWCAKRYALKVQYGKYPKTKVYNSFVMGLYVGLDEKLTAQREETVEEHFNGGKEKTNYALISINDTTAITEFMHSEVSDIKTKASRTKYNSNSEAFLRGVEEGNNINISKAIE